MEGRGYICSDMRIAQYMKQFQVNFLFSIKMNKKIFYRNSLGKGVAVGRATRSNKLSMDDLTPLFTRAPSEIRKRNSNDHYETGSKLERSTFKKNNKMNSTASVGASILVSKTSSPLKFSVRQSQAKHVVKDKLKFYKFYYQIGFGGFGRVWKVYNKEDMRDWAMKEISKRKVLQKNNVESVLNERKILSGLSHPFLINMKCAFQDRVNLYLVMDYLRGGDLRYHICYKEGFTQTQIKFIIACILVALEYVHSMNIIHKDLKPQNIVFEENGYARLTDFGIAKQETNDAAQLRNQSSGTPVYMAPEILFKKDYSYSSDFYSLGVILYELAIGKRPYEGKNRAEIREEMLRRDICLTEKDLPQGWSPYLPDLVNRLLIKTQKQRLGFAGAREIKEHPFFQDFKWRRLERKEMKPPFIPNVISEMKEYLDQISLFNHINEENQQNMGEIDEITNTRFADYDYDKIPEKKTQKKLKGTLKKFKRGSQKKIIG